MSRTRMMLAALVVALAGTPLAAQATLNFAGSISDMQTRVHKIQLDHGATAQSLTLNLGVTTASADGVDVELIDLASQLALAPITASVHLGSAGSGNDSLVTPSRSGMHEFFLTIDTWGFSSSTYNITVSVSGVAQAALVDAGPQTVAHASGALSTVHGRAFVYYGDYWGGGTDKTRFKVNFGTTPQVVNAAFEFDTGFDITAIRVYEESPSGDTLLYSVSGMFFYGLVQLTTTPRSGEVIFRVEADIGPNGSVIDWNVLFPTTVSAVGVVGAPSAIATDGGGGGGGGGGCAAETGGGALLAALLCLLGIAGLARLRRA